MAEAKSDVVAVSLSGLERVWIKQSIGSQIKMLLRSRQKEIAGGEVWVLRGKEIDVLNSILGKF